MIKILILLISINFLASATDDKSLSCSRRDRGTIIYYINGVGNSFEEARTTTNFIENIVRPSGGRIDINRKIEFEFGHNSSESLFLDGFQTVLQKAEEVGESTSASLLGSFLFQPLRLCKLKPVFCAVAGGGIGLISLGQSYISQQDISKISNELKIRLELGFKVIVVSHSQGNLYANYVYDRLISTGLAPEILDKYYGNLQVGSAASFSRSKKFRVYTLLEDFVINKLRLIYPSVFAPRFMQISDDDSQDTWLKHGMVKTYLNSNILVNGPKQGGDLVTRSSAEVFRDLLEEVAWMLDNNDNKCCNGENGRFYRKSYEDDATDLFISSTSHVQDGLNLKSDGSQICGNVTFEKAGNASNIELKNTVFEGDGLTKVKGNVFFEDVTVANSNGEILFENSNVNAPQVISTATITGNPKFFHPLFFFNSQTSGSPVIRGNLNAHPDHSSNVTMIVDSKINGNSDLNGFYVINDRELNNTIIDGQAVTNSSNAFNFLYIDTNNRNKVINGGELRGFGYIAGVINNYLKMNAYKIGNVISGVIVQDTATVESADFFGSLLLDGNTTFSGRWNGDTIKEGQFIGHATNSNFNLIDILGAPRIISSSFNGGQIFRSSDARNPFVSNSHFNQAVGIYCDAVLNNETDSSKDYGCGYVSGAANGLEERQLKVLEDIELKKQAVLEYNAEMARYYQEKLFQMDSQSAPVRY